ncbi:MAG: response regulator [Clostridia bacterium]|nr:response regulator [Clostridia bacterium]
MKNRFRSILDVLNTDIFVGDRLEKNLRNMSIECYIVIAIGAVMFAFNILQKDLLVALSPLSFLVTGVVSLFFIRTRKKRVPSVILTNIAVIIVFTADVVIVDNGFAFLWIMLVPLSVCYLISVRSGIILSVYFETLLIVMFYTPLRGIVESHYPVIVLERFPVLYFFHVLITGFVMYQYQKNVIAQMRYEEQLKDSVQNAEQASQAKSDFLANMSHEIRTPINTVLGLNQLIYRDCREALAAHPGEAAETRALLENVCANADSIESAGNILLSLVNDVLDLSKIEAGRMELVNTEYTLSTLLNDIGSMAGFKARTRGLSFSIRVQETIPDTLFGDPVRLKQIIVNVVNNAIKYTERGSVSVSVSLREPSPPAAGELIHLLFSVQDTGIGIREEDLSHLFRRFERVDLQRNSSVEGTGLGLTITADLLNLMNGSIRVDSEYGKGSTFLINVPQTVVSAEPIGDFGEKRRLSTLDRQQYHESFRAPEALILIVDDTPMNITITRGLLKKTAVRIDAASGGEEALRKIRHNAYDLVLLDQRMPNMDGIQTLARIRETAAGKALPVICMTADAVSGAREKYLAEGFDDYLSKPILGEQLESLLRRYLPPEKLEIVRDASPEPETDAGPEQADPYALLRAAGILPETGIMYCGNDEAFWQEMLRTYASEYTKKSIQLENCFRGKDWDGYMILVHSIKSTSLTVGAEALSVKAAAAEAAAAEKDEAFLSSGYPELSEAYHHTAETIVRFFGEITDPSESSGILEFSPENPAGKG